jgi:TraM recognition site of TraD and TraG/Type IV secretion-system coupling protein DNA-binding domain
MSRHLHHLRLHHAAARPNHAVERWLVEPGAPLHRLSGLADHWVTIAERFAPAVLGIAAAAGIVGLLLGRVQRWRLARNPRLVTIGVPPEVSDGGGLLLWQALHDLLRPRFSRLLSGQPHVAWEIDATDAGTIFRLWVPRAIPPGLIERAVCAAWPGASATVAEAPIIPPRPEMARATSELVLSGPGWFSLDTTTKPDPLPLILGQLAGLGADEHSLVQVMARPATSREQHRLRTAARRIRKGESTSRLLRFLDLLRTRAPQPPRLDPTITPDVSAVMQKSTAPLYRCLIRVTVTTRSRPEARGRIHAILGSFAPYNGPRVWLRRRRVKGAYTKLQTRRLGRRAFLLSAPELAALAHLPTQEAIPGVVMAGAREVAPPPGLPSKGKTLGISGGRPVRLSVIDARQHLHILGPTGVGKSTLIGQLVLSDFNAGRGAVVIDPKGDLVEDLLARIPAGREGDVDLLDPLDPSPPGLNVLDSADRDLGVDQLVGIFRRVFERFWGPRTDDILRSALLTLTAGDRTATLVDVPRLLSDSAWRASLLQKIDDPVGLGPFWKWYEELSEPLQAQVTGPLLNKLRAFLLRRPVRAIVGQPTSTLDIADSLNNGRLLLAKLPKGTLGEDTSRLLGSFIVAKTWQAALGRAALEPERRRDSSLYVDEVHNYLNLPTPFEDIAAEARSYRLSLCLAHQHLAQLPRDLREALAANARTKIYFQVSRDDAAHLEREVRPELAAHDLAHLPLHTAAVRLCNGGQATSTFTLSTKPLPDPIDGQAASVREAARRRYGTQRADVEKQIAERQRQPHELTRRQRPRSDTSSCAPPGTPSATPIGTPSKDGVPHSARTPRNRQENGKSSRSRQGRRRVNE